MSALTFKALKYICLTGAHGSGKSFAALSMFGDRVLPGSDEVILVVDTEYSTTTFSHLFEMRSINWWDITANTPAEQHFEELEKRIKVEVEKVKKEGKRVIQIDFDTNEPIQDSIFDYVRANAKKFGKSAKQYDKMAGILYADVKKALFEFLTRMADICELVTIVAHERKVWKNDRPTKKVRPVGLSPFQQLSHLTVCLDREVPAGKSSVDVVPKGIVLKDRCIARDESGKTRPVFPPTFPSFSGDAIRYYMENLVDYKKLKKGEQAVEHEPTEAELLEMRKEVAEAEERLLNREDDPPQDSKSASVDPLAKKPEESKPTEGKPAESEKSVSGDRIDPQVAGDLITLTKRIDTKMPGYWNAIRDKLPKYTVGKTQEFGDIHIDSLETVRGAVLGKLKQMGLSADPN